eukprot:CAMPEP_0194574384 /NCGR_PEP_ID=MMETSP0292-20121207/10259_1 /TAXON_ID=39354 /ORGANISM="Heterosigma akashiwo, Strain CCMP2393" /LENGTH=446 /DNA_ID=CAMNT_0039425899 /DNA_START=99 /DNA_END=1436 /DNA_ORIENTATION=+
MANEEKKSERKEASAGGSGVPLLREMLSSSFYCKVKILSWDEENDLDENRIDIRSGVLLISTKETHHTIDLTTCSISQFTVREGVFPVQLTPNGKNPVTLGFSDRAQWTTFLERCQDIMGSAFQLDDFTPLATIGRGKFGKVSVSQRGNHLYAVKEVILASRKVVRHCQYERIILAKMTACDFVVGLEYAKHRGDKVYFIMEFCPGGDLFTALMQYPLTAEGVIFFSTEILLALQFLHSKYIIYRDLKPENILLDAEGHVKLADLGLAKVLGRGGRTATLCGTEVYVAPETLAGQGYGLSADFWQFGCFVFELYTGHSPFYVKGRGKEENREAILHGEYEFPEGMPPDAAHMIKNLLKVDVRSRLGCRQGENWTTLRKHKFLRHINWDDAEERRLEPPFVTVQPGADVLQNFDDEFVNETPRYDSEEREEKLMYNELLGFDYCEEW